MSIVLKKATRKNTKLKIGMFGPSGSGKTYSALKFAKGLVGDWSKIAVIDTENSSAELYSQLGEFLHTDLAAPYGPEKYIKYLHQIKSQAPQVECVIIDSITHEWSGAGGCLSLHDAMPGNNSFSNWAKVTPLHQKFINAIVQAPFHIIVTGRSKTDYAINQEAGKKSSVQKLGLKTDTRDGFEYELTLSFQIEMNHHAKADKDRTSLFVSRHYEQIDESHGELLAKWNNEGIEVVPNWKISLCTKVKKILEEQQFEKLDNTVLEVTGDVFQVRSLNSLKEFEESELIKLEGLL